MREVRTARGRILNMQALSDANPTTRAVSNVNVNAKGDLLDEHGEVIVDKGVITAAYYEGDPKATKAVINKLPSRDKFTTPTLSVIVSPNTANTKGVLKDIIVIKVASIFPKFTPVSKVVCYFSIYFTCFN